MKIGILKESIEGEKRVAMSPVITKKLIDNGFEVYVEENAGEESLFKDSDYIDSGAIIASRETIFKSAKVLVKINPFDELDLKEVNKDHVLISQLYHKSSPELIKAIAATGASAFSMDAMPRITRAQDMDVLSSQNNLAGYKAVILGAYEMTKIFPLMMTAAGTITPSRVLIFGVGVAGLQAIATAKRLGAVVEATDIRTETKEQAESLGAKFISVETDEEGSSDGFYAKEASEEYKKKQKEAVEKSLFQADLVITTAMVPGKKAPLLISEEQVNQMKNGAVIIDLAASAGGNCALSKLNETVRVNGVKIIGKTIAPESLSNNASDLYSKNVFNFLMHITKEQAFVWDMEDEITKGTLIVKDGVQLNN